MASVAARELIVHCTGPTEEVPSTAGAIMVPQSGEVLIVFARLDHLHSRMDELRAMLDPSEAARSERFVLDDARERFVLGHGLLREVLGHALDTDPGTIVIQRGPYGKPFLPTSQVHFNFSDTKDAIAIGISRDQEIGVDVETHHRSVDHHAVSEHYFTPEEVKDIRTAGADAKARFLELWTRKEAVLKASGVGIMDDLHSLRVDAPRNVLTISHDAFIALAAPEYHVRTMRIAPDHFLSIATGAPIDRCRLVAIGRHDH
ncbi:MAG: 4'-phosphopantetheinyl transferase superfamily protein [Flavobacteriales bacterium]|nr:4'-phosphopantetheinyl transferase superfamily protein [Flavobacteriales bacterium]MCB9194317.1 4'-phosphopantetheinyl transferase superfamily protein [Flavobacteriales bacterium]